MNIVIIHHFGELGGGTISCIDIAKVLKKDGNNITIIVPKPCDYIISACNRYSIKLVNATESVPCFTYHNASSGLFRALVKFILAKKNFPYWESLLTSLKADLVILNSLVEAPIIRIIKSIGFRCLCFVRETSPITGGKLGKKIIQNFIKKVDAIVFLTKFDKKAWNLNTNKQYIVPDIIRDDLLYIPIGQKNVIKENLGISLVNKNIMYAGGIAYAKGALDLLKAYEKISEKMDTNLIILGKTYEEIIKMTGIKKIVHLKTIKYIKQCYYLIKKLNTNTKRVFLIGVIDDMSPWYYISDVVVFPVKEVHQARPIYEAGFFSKPIILPDYQNFYESVKKNENGIFYKKDNVNSLSSVLINLLKSPKIMEELGNQNNILFRERHSEKEMLNCLKAIVKDLSMTI